MSNAVSTNTRTHSAMLLTIHGVGIADPSLSSGTDIRHVERAYRGAGFSHKTRAALNRAIAASRSVTQIAAGSAALSQSIGCA